MGVQLAVGRAHLHEQRSSNRGRHDAAACAACAADKRRRRQAGRQAGVATLGGWGPLGGLGHHIVAPRSVGEHGGRPQHAAPARRVRQLSGSQRRFPPAHQHLLGGPGGVRRPPVAPCAAPAKAVCGWLSLRSRLLAIPRRAGQAAVSAERCEREHGRHSMPQRDSRLFKRAPLAQLVF